MDHYRARVPRDAGLDRRTVGLALTEAEWAQLEGLAREKEWSLAMVASQVVRLALKQRIVAQAEAAGHDAASLLTQHYRGEGDR